MFSPDLWNKSAAADAYEIDNSLRFNVDDSAYLSRVPAVDGDRKTWTFSCWFKKSGITGDMRLLTTNDSGAYVGFKYSTNEDVLRIDAAGIYNYTTAVYRDPSAWYHVVACLDTTQGVGADRSRAWINGTEVTWANPGDNQSLNADSDFNYTSKTMSVGSKLGVSEFDGYIAECYFLDGAGVTDASDFGELDSTTNQWIPLDGDDVKAAVTFGTNGFYQKYGATELADSFTDSSGGAFTGSDFSACTSNLTISTGTGINQIIDGTTTASSGCIPTVGQTVSTKEVTFDCGSGVTKIFTHAELKVSMTYDDGAWKWQGSNDDVSYSDIGSGTFTIQGPSAEAGPFDITAGLSSNTTAYRYYRWQGVSGTTTGSNFWTEIMNLKVAPPGTGFHTITAVGDVANSRAQKKVGDSSIKFVADTGSYLSIPDSSDWELNSFTNYTVEMWVRTDLSEATNRLWSTDTTGNTKGYLSSIHSNGTIDWLIGTGSSWAMNIDSGTGAIVADTWTHVAFVKQSTTARLYVAGVEKATGTFADGDSYVDVLRIGRYEQETSADYDGYIDEIRFSDSARYPDGTTFTPSTTEFTADSNTKLLIHSNWDGGLGADSSGNYNTFTPTNLVATDQMVDTPTNSFATFNALSYGDNGGNFELREGNLQAYMTSGVGKTHSTFSLFDDGCYWEMMVGDTGGGYGIALLKNANLTTSSQLGADSYSEIAYRPSTGNLDIDGSTDTTYATASAGDILNFAFKSGRLYVGKSNTWFNSGAPASGTGYVNGSAVTGDWCAACSLGANSPNYGSINFGADSSFAGKTTAQGNQDDNDKGDFYYAPPTDYLALCTDNLSNPDIKLPGEYFNTLLWTGDAAASRSITGLGFQADMMWSKIDGGHQHNLVDSVRGVDQRLLMPDSTAAEDTTASQGYYDSLDSDGWSMTYGAHTGWNVNKSGYDYVGWAWKAGGAPTATNSAGVGAVPTAGSVKIDGSNLGSALAGSIAATKISANTTTGFSIVGYTGDDASSATIAHGLSEAPELIIIKSRDSAESWYVGSSAPEMSFTLSDYLTLDTDSGESSSDTIWDDTDPSASIFTVGTNDAVNNTDDFIAYCFHSVEGYSKVGGYTGNGNADGTFIYCGFRPAYAWFKRIDDSQSWLIFDDARSPYNEMDKTYRADTNAVEQSIYEIDMVSNGIKIRNAESIFNHSGGTYLLLAFAESPFKTANAR